MLYHLIPRIFILISIILILVSCKIDRKKNVDRDRFTFKMTDDSFLFFKNVRQIYYDFTNLNRANLYTYRFSDRYQGSERPVLNPTIVVDWMKNEAYVLIEPNAYLADEETFEIIEENSLTGQRYQYSLKERGRENMLEFATKIYEGIMAEHNFLMKVKGEYEQLFAHGEDRESFRVVMGDYYRLTRVF